MRSDRYLGTWELVPYDVTETFSFTVGNGFHAVPRIRTGMVFGTFLPQNAGQKKVIGNK